MTVPSQKYPFGAIDGKVSSVLSSKIIPSNDVTVASLPIIYARLGPSRTLDDELPPFCWSEFDNVTLQHQLYPDTRRDRVFSHYGHPDCFDFKWQIFPPR